MELSVSTLKRRIKKYGLRRRQVECDINTVRESVRNIVDDHGSLQCYRSVWHTLRLNGIQVPRVADQEICMKCVPKDLNEEEHIA